jgi:hypothetical protein
LEQLPALRGGSATEWAPASYLVPYIHALRDAGEEPRWTDEDEDNDEEVGEHGPDAVAVRARCI